VKYCFSAVLSKICCAVWAKINCSDKLLKFDYIGFPPAGAHCSVNRAGKATKQTEMVSFVIIIVVVQDAA